MGSTIVVANRKGGSGKTTSTINIADGLARKGKKVLVVEEDEKGNIFEAYYLYRQVIESMEESLSADIPELYSVVSQSFNNAAIILYDAGKTELARNFLHKAIEICPDNITAQENCQLIS
jgi:cellulose biosynthesis protein BcsQ